MTSRGIDMGRLTFQNGRDKIELPIKVMGRCLMASCTTAHFCAHSNPVMPSPYYFDR
jgi:hypothetical protein